MSLPHLYAKMAIKLQLKSALINIKHLSEHAGKILTEQDKEMISLWLQKLDKPKEV